MNSEEAKDNRTRLLRENVTYGSIMWVNCFEYAERKIFADRKNLCQQLVERARCAFIARTRARGLSPHSSQPAVNAGEVLYDLLLDWAVNQIIVNYT